MTKQRYKIDRFLASVLVFAIAMTLGCSDDDPQVSADPPEEFAFVDDDHGHESSDCAVQGGCETQPLSMCTWVRGGEVMAFVTVNDREEHENECGERPYRLDHADNDITVSQIIVGNSDFETADSLKSGATTLIEAGGTYIIKARYFDGNWWHEGSMEIEPGGAQATDDSGYYSNFPTTSDEFIAGVAPKWEDYGSECDGDEPRMTSDDEFGEFLYGEDPRCTGEVGYDPYDDDDPDYSNGNNTEEPDGVGLNNSDDG